MKKLLAMMAGSASASALNLIALTLAASKVDLHALDVYFVYRDATESILKLLFVSQIGPICIAAMRSRTDNTHPVRSALLIGGAATAISLCLWTAFFPLIAHFFVNPEAPVRVTGLGLLELSVGVFCLFTWLDAIASSVLVHRRLFAQNHFGNFISAAATCAWMAVPEELPVESMALAFAVGKVLGTLPKILICFWPQAVPKGESASNKNEVMEAADRHSENENGLPGVLAMAAPYIPSNLLQQFNKFAYLAGAAFLAPGLFAIFNIYRRYYTALQNLITVNIFNFSASRLTDPAEAPLETVRLLDRHTLSFLTVYAGGSLLMLLCSLPTMQSRLPEFVTSPYAPLLWSVTLLNYLPDGINFVLSRQSMLQNDLRVDSRLNTAQALANIVFLYPSMRYFGIAGLAYSTMLVCTLFAACRLWRLREQHKPVRPAVNRIAAYGLLTFGISLFSLAVSPWLYCLGTLILSLGSLAHLKFSLRRIA